MTEFIERLRRMSWLAVEAGLLIVSLCLLLNIIVGKDGGTFVTAVAANTMAFLKDLPAGIIAGLGLLAFAWAIISKRDKK